MKKNFIKLAVIALLSVFYCCGIGKETPSQVAEESVKCIKEENFDKYVELLYFEDSVKDEQKAGMKAMYKSILQEKIKEQQKENKGIKDYKAIKEDIIKDSIANVDVEINYNNGKKEIQKTKLKKDSDGNWKIELGK